MKIELNVESAQLNDEIKDLLSTLTIEQKQEMATQLMSKIFLDLDGKIDRAWIERQAIADFRKKLESDSYDYKRYNSLSDKELLDNYDVKEKIKKYEVQRRTFVNEILKEVVELAKVEIKTMVEKDEEIIKIKNLVLEEVKKEFANMVKNAMLQYFSSQMSNLFSQMSALSATENSNNNYLQSIENRLNKHNIY